MKKKKANINLLESLGELVFMIDNNKLWMHRAGQGHDDLMIEIYEIPELVKRLKRIYKEYIKSLNI